MKIVAIGIGTRGDVEPLAELGVELVGRGHDFTLASLEGFRGLCEGRGLKFVLLPGSASNLMQYLVLDNRGDTDFVKGCIKLFRENPGIIDSIASAVRGADFVIYNFLAGFAYHPCELLGIPCARVFYSPFDATDKYSLYTPEHNSPKVYSSYKWEEFGMNLLTCLLANKWRKENGLPKWTMKSDYRMKAGRPVLTFYPVSPVLMEPDPKWGSHIHVTGWWFHPKGRSSYVPSAELSAFLSAGSPPVFAGFGRMLSPEYSQVQHMLVSIFKRTGIRAVLQASMLTEEEKKACGPNIFLLPENIPYAWLFPRCRAVIHHGGNSTNGLGLLCGKPTLIVALALDQYYYGRTVNELGAGPAPLYICKKMCAESDLEAAVLSLAGGEYDAAAAGLATRLASENGCRDAASFIEEYV